MKPVVWLGADTLYYPTGGGHLWVYLNWALGLLGIGCRVVWLEGVYPDTPADRLAKLVDTLKGRLAPYGLGGSVALCSRTGDALPPGGTEGCTELAEARAADLLLSLSYSACAGVVGRFRRSALVDIDPGLLQVWLSEGLVNLGQYDVYFSIGETVGRPGARFPSGGIPWQYTPPCVALDWWPVRRAAVDAPFTTVSHWSTWDEWVTFGEESYHNDKRSGFEPFFDLPQRTNQPLELALCLAADQQLRLTPYEEKERGQLEAKGWRVRHAHAVAATPADYQGYIQGSKGELSCAKPSCVRLQNAWVSDRTLCYLASGKPAVVQHTGPSRFLPDAAGLFRFRDMPEAVRGLETVATDYDRQCRLARALAEEFFDARAVVKRLLERTLT
jgi:hypothetical protein